MNIIYDLTQPLNNKTPVYPGDQQYLAETIHQVGNKSSFSLQKIQFCNHAGTHIDFPAHVIKQGKSSSDFPLSHLVGKGIIIECPSEKNGKISIEELEKQDIQTNDIVFLRNIQHLERKTACYLMAKRVKIIGTDNLSIDNPVSVNLEIHNLLLQNDILIVESLKLDKVPLGRCTIIIAPLNIDSDGAPARVFMYK